MLGRAAPARLFPIDLLRNSSNFIGGVAPSGAGKIEDIKTPPRTVGPIGSALLSINGMIGAGIFAMPAILYSTLGSFAPWMILIVGLLVGCGTLIIAQLAAMFRQSGGPQLYAQAAFGPATGFQVGWLLLLAIMASRAANFHVLVSYLAAILPFFADPMIHSATVLALIALITLINIVGMRVAVGGLVVGTLCKLTPIVLICLVGYATKGLATEFALPTFGAVEGTALLIYYAFAGGIANGYAAGEVKNPRRTIPRTMIQSLFAIIAFYMFVQFAFNAVAPDVSDANTPLAAMGEAVLGETGALMMALAAIFSIATNQHTFWMTGPRIMFGMARRGLLPAWLTHLSSRSEVPDYSIYLFSTIVAALSLSGGFVLLAEVMGVGSQLIGFFAYAAFVVLRLRGQAGHPQAIGIWWWLCIAVASAYSIFAIIQASLNAFSLTGGLIALGTGLYFIAKRDETFTPEPEFD